MSLDNDLEEVHQALNSATDVSLDSMSGYQITERMVLFTGYRDFLCFAEVEYKLYLDNAVQAYDSAYAKEYLDAHSKGVKPEAARKMTAQVSAEVVEAASHKIRVRARLSMIQALVGSCEQWNSVLSRELSRRIEAKDGL